MGLHTSRGSRQLGRCAGWLLVALTAAPAFAQQPPPRTLPDEKFEKVDPYTKGQAEDLERAGYHSLGPFSFAEGVKTIDIEELLGTQQVLWVETAHFKLGSTLFSYRCSTDDREQQLLREELGRLAKKLPRLKRDAAKLDPWLRLHLYAQRLEEEYADFETRFGLRDEDFAANAKASPLAPSPMGRGPYLGQELKFTVLLTEKGSQVARFAKRWLALEETGSYRAPLPGGTLFFGTSAQTGRQLGSELDTALYGLVASELAHNLCDGFRGAGYQKPLWFRLGLGMFYGRKIDERWSIYVPRISGGTEDETWRWEPRLHGLVSNGYVTKWDEMLTWMEHAKLEAGQQMSAWSRVVWLMGLEKGDLHAFLMGVSEPLNSSVAETEKAGVLLEQQKKALLTAFGKSPAELDEAWRKWVLRKYPKK